MPPSRWFRRGNAETAQTSASRASTGRRDHPTKGIALTILGTGVISLNDAAMKWVVADHPIGEAVFVRGLFAMLPILLLLHRTGGWRAARWESFSGQALSAALLVAALFAFIFSLSQLPLAIVTIIIYLNPMFVTALAPWLLGEKVGWRRWSAVILGFAGALLVIRPDSGEVAWLFALPIGVAFVTALRDVLIRRLVVRETSVSILIFSNVAVVLCALPTAAFGWTPLSAVDIVLLALAGLGFGFGIFILTDAFRFGDASLLSPFKYSGVIWALVLGFLIWSEHPGPEVLAGALLIVLSGLFILWRERQQPTATETGTKAPRPDESERG